jgi:excisionase family DNA binding protein
MAGVSTKTTYRWIESGKIPVVKFGDRTYRFPAGAVIDHRVFTMSRRSLQKPIIPIPIQTTVMEHPHRGTSVVLTLSRSHIFVENVIHWVKTFHIISERYTTRGKHFDLHST